MKYKGIIFDLDGVICFTDQYHYQAWKKLADKEGIPFDEKINHRLRGVSRLESLNIILEQSKKSFSEQEKEEMAAEKNAQYVKLLENMTPKDLSEERKETLLALREAGIKLAIGSSSKNARTILNKIGLGNFFDAISDGNQIHKSKPDPEVFVKAAELLALSPAECLVVEDAKAGIEAAAAGGFHSAGIGEAAKDKRTTYPIEKFADLLIVIGENRHGL